MRFEYLTLVFMTIFFLIAWVPASLGKWKTLGNKWLMSNRSPVLDKELPRWAQRAERAHNNLKDNIPGFIVAILLLGQFGKFDRGTEIAASLYVIFRVSHMASYIYGNVPLRSLSFFLALVMNLYLLLKAII